MVIGPHLCQQRGSCCSVSLCDTAEWSLRWPFSKSLIKDLKQFKPSSYCQMIPNKSPPSPDREVSYVLFWTSTVCVDSEIQNQRCTGYNELGTGRSLFCEQNTLYARWNCLVPAAPYSTSWSQRSDTRNLPPELDSWPRSAGRRIKPVVQKEPDNGGP